MEKDTTIFWLVVEDCENDFLLLLRACLELEPQLCILRCKDGEEARSFLIGELTNQDPAVVSTLPKLILSDLETPRCNGLGLLRWVKTRPNLRDVPFILLTASQNPSNLNDARELGADEYLIKSNSWGELVDLLRHICERYAGLAEDSGLESFQ